MNPIASFPEPSCQHVARKDNPFAARMRFHQSWYRHSVLGCPPGPNPSARGAFYGNILGEADGAKGKNFLNAAIRAIAEARFPPTKQDNDTRRLYHNLLSSQPMCFNLFGPLKHDPALATALFSLLRGFPADARIVDIEFEYAPDKKLHLNDATAFDAFVKYERPDGRLGFLGIETKLSEPFSQVSYVYSERYSQWEGRAEAWWKSGTAKEYFPRVAYNQLWRNHLLAFSVLHQPNGEYAEGHCVVVYPKGDEACTSALETYRQHLTPSGDERLLAWDLDDLVGRWANGSEERQWLGDFRTRYIDLQASEKAWKEFTQSKNLRSRAAARLPTDTSEKILETLSVRHMTNTNGLAVEQASPTEAIALGPIPDPDESPDLEPRKLKYEDA